MQFSLTMQGLAVAVLGTILKSTGNEMAHPDLAAWVATGIQVVGALIAYVGRVRQGDLTWYGKRK